MSSLRARGSLLARIPLVAVLVAVLVGWAGARDAARAEDAPLPPPVVRRGGRVVAPQRAAPGPDGPVRPPPAVPASAVPDSLGPPAPQEPPSRSPLPRDPASLPPPRIRRVASDGVRVPHVPVPALPSAATREAPATNPGSSVRPPGLPSTSMPGALVSPPDRPERPARASDPRPEDLLFEVERPGGILKRYPEGDGTAVYVMVGNPRLSGQQHQRKDGRRVEALSIKASTFVAWVDERSLPEFSRLGIPGADAPGGGTPGSRKVGPDQPMAQLFEDAVIGIYAEGDVDVAYGTLMFRAASLYLEPRTYRGLLVDSTFDGRLTGKGLEQQGVPVHVRARRGRLVAKGLMVFDQAEVSTNRADDRLVLRVQSLTVEQMAEEEKATLEPENPALLGFRTLQTQRFRARGIEARGERVPLGYVPYASFGTSTQEPIPMTLRRADLGNRSSLGMYGFLGLGGDLGPDGDPWGTWVVDVGGYTKRGGAGGVEVGWDRAGRTTGRVRTWGVFFDAGEDRDGYDPDGQPLRGRIVAESRTTLARDLLLDVEFSTFSDRHFNREFFEREDLTHKDYESYGRLLYRRPAWAATLTGKWHERDFVTETLEAPQAGLWAGSLPILVPGGLGGLGVDLTSASQGGWLLKRFDDATATDGYEAWRLGTDTRLNAGVDVGDVRLSGYAGASVIDYSQRTDGGQDLTRTALLAGLRANLQLHRTFAARGGPFGLDGLRHVVDVDAIVQGRFFDSADPSDVPDFDRQEEQRQASSAVLRARNRWQTRRGAALAPRDLLDLETSFAWYPDDKAPYLQESPWSFEWSMRGEPAANGRWMVGSEGWVDGEGGLRTLTAAVGFKPHERVDVALAYRYLQDESAAPLVQAAWRFSERYEVRVTESFNFRDEDNLFRLLFRRFSDDHVWTFGVSLRDADDVGFELDFRPAIGGATGAPPSAFESEVDLDPLGVFR